MQLIEQAGRAVGAWLGRMRPIYAHYGVTHRCAMRCRMCAVWKTADPAAELAPPQVARLADQLRRVGVRMMALGGGEPFVRRDIAELVAIFSRRGMDVRLLTNGIGVGDDRIEAVVAAGLRHVSISLDTLDPETEKFIYGGQDVWAAIVDTMRRFRARMSARPGSISVMNVCVSRLNLDALPDLVDFAAQEGYFCSFIPVALAPDPAVSDGFAAHAPELALRPEDMLRMERAYDRLIALKQNGAPIANTSRFLRASANYFKTGQCRWECDAGRLYLSIGPDGAIAICHHYPPFAGHDTPDLAVALRQAAAAGALAAQRRTCPGCIRPCWAEVSHVMHHPGSALEAFRCLIQSRRAKSPGAAHNGK